jgi:uncharacterized protein (UPF0128 family)
MKAKDKAKELVEKFEKVKVTFQASAFSPVEEYPLNENEAKQCALICVDECLKIEKSKDMDFSKRNLEYWKEVKEEINNL